MTPPRFAVFGAECCKPCGLALQGVAVTWVASLPLACTAALTRSSGAVAAIAAIVALPRLLWRFGESTEGARFKVAMALYWNLVYGNFLLSPVLIAVCCFAAPWYCLPPALLYALYTQAVRPEHKDSSPWRWFAEREWGYHAFRHWLRLRLHVSEALRSRAPDAPVVLGVHPHGVASDYRILMDGMLYEALPGRAVYTLAASVLFRIPFVRELCLWTRCIDAGKPYAMRALRHGHSIMVIPGGEMEQIRTKPGREEVCLSKRMGFVKLALQTGAALVPCYAFGCVDLYDTYSACFGLREALRKRFGVCIPLYSGSVGVLPKRLPCDLVIGDPLEVTCADREAPTNDEVAAAHAAYVDALRALFDAHKERFGYEGRTLVVV